ncbi:MAG: FprA family A-type flavoprotein [Lachnospiraceae bacterium]|nr:FprA family A-type flavoprotein [Lachnospiraceae bacterium]
MFVSDAVRYVGVADKELDIFESQYPLPNGMLYNSYVIEDEKIAVLDTVDKRAVDEWLSNVEKVLGDKKPDYLVIHHLEPDHSAGILGFVKKYPGVRLIGNAQTVRLLPQFFDEDLTSLFEIVDEGTSISLGEHSLTFIKAPMVHWPEVMVSFEAREGILFAADAFGKFGVEEDTDEWAYEARRYYFNIVGKYGMQVQALLKKVSALDIKTICPLHGPVIKENLEYYLGIYDVWSRYEPEDKGVFIACASIHGNTMKAAEFLAEELKSAGVEKVVLTDICRSDVAEAVEDAFRYDRMVLMSSSYDAGLFPPMETFLHHLKAKAYCRRKVAVIQNGTWAPSAAKCMRAIIEPLKDIEYVGEDITIKTTMSAENKEQLKTLAGLLSQA